MKKRLTLFVIVIILIISISGCTGTDYDFRQTNWGMTKKQVKAAESSEIYEEQFDALVYKVKHLSNDFFCMYEFEDGKLYKSSYILDVRYADPNNWIIAYNYIKGRLVEDHGTPIMEILTLNGVVTSHVEKLQASALLTEKVVLSSTWVVEDTFLGVELIAVNGKIILTVQHYAVPK